MLIRMTIAITGQWVADRGQEVKRPDAEALRLIEAGFAEAVAAPQGANALASESAGVPPGPEAQPEAQPEAKASKKAK